MDLTDIARRCPAAALSHDSAAELLGIELLDPVVPTVTVPRDRGRLVVPGCRVVRRNLDGDLHELDDVRVTSALRTVADLARTLLLGQAVVAADSALRQQLVTDAELQVRLGGAVGRGARRLRAVAAAADPLSGSVLETRLRLVLREALLPPPRTQYVVRDRDGLPVARVDFAWPGCRLIVEADGFAFHSDRAAYRSDRARLNELERLGWRVLRFSWEDVAGRPEYVVSLVAHCLVARAA